MDVKQDTTINLMQCLERAIEDGNLTSVQAIHEINPDTITSPFSLDRDYPGEYPIHLAVYFNRYEIIRYLISNAPTMVNQPDAFDNTPLVVCIQNDDVLLAEYFISYGANINEVLSGSFERQGKTVLYYAIEQGRFKIAENLIEMRARLDLPSGPHQQYPIHIAVEKGDFELVKQLLAKAPSQVNQMNGMKITPIMVALNKGYMSLVFFLLSHGARFNGTILPIDHILDEITNHERPKQLAWALFYLLKGRIWSNTLFDALIQYPRPEYLALAYWLSHKANIWSDEIGHALFAHPRPFSLAFALNKLKSAGCWADWFIMIAFKQAHPADFIYLLYDKIAANEIKKSSKFIQQYMNEQERFSVDCHPDFSKSLRQARCCHRLFSLKALEQDDEPCSNNLNGTALV